MATTINAQNALQIREKPMEVYIHLLAGASATISNYNVTSTVENNDGTLGNTSWSMRKVTDLANGGFPLDGSCEWYDSSTASSGENGKMGVRGKVGSNVVLTITGSGTITTVTVASENVGSIIVGGTTYPSTGLNVIPINANTATLTFTPEDADSRVEINYIIPGAELSVTNENLISCTLALRSNLSVSDHSWEESDIEFQMYYPYNIASSFAYIQNDWPISYQAGYDSDLSTTRQFYLSEPIVQEENVITVKGVDASHRLEERVMPEQWYESYRGNAHQLLYNKVKNEIQSAGITLKRVQSVSGTQSGTHQYAVLPEMTARDFLSGVMNMTLNHKRGGTRYGIQFVDAGIPTLEYGDGKTFGNTWTIYKSDCGEWTEQYEQNIRTISDSNGDRKFNETIGITNIGQLLGGDCTQKNFFPGWLGGYASNDDKPETLYAANQMLELNYDGFFFNVFDEGPATTVITSTPSRGVFKCTKTSVWESYNVTGPFSSVLKRWHVKNGKCIIGFPVTITGGVKQFANSNNLPGVNVETEPFWYGSITDSNGETLINYPSLFNRSLRTGSFTWKGDPRMQPLDYLDIQNDTGDGRGNITARITGIELTHEGGGTEAEITWREWS